MPVPYRYTAAAMGKVQHLHFIGIGGVGMNGIAQVLLNLGYQISGSDIKANEATQRLQEQGATIYIGHAPEQIAGADAVIVSSAIRPDNPELIAAQQQRIPVVPRAEMLAELMRFYYGIAVAGTHGKTTTTSLIASLLIEGGLDPSFIIGGRLNAAGSYARLGQGEILVAEADESDASFLYLQPMMAVVTNIDADHLSTYQGDFKRLQAAFIEFLHHLPFYGTAILCGEDERLKAILPQINRPLLRYGFSEDMDIQAFDLRYQHGHSWFQIRIQQQEPFTVQLNLPGEHNVLNALAAIAVADQMGVPRQKIQSGLRHFQGIGRRFQMSRCQLNGRPFDLVDDYGHHPREIAATLAAARSNWPDRRLLLVFQPHRYSRTAELFDEFVPVLAQADQLILTPIYAAGEEALPEANIERLAAHIAKCGPAPIVLDSITAIADCLAEQVQADDLVLLMGAGSIGQIAAEIRQNAQIR